MLVTAWLIRWRWPLLVLALVLTAVCWWPAQQLQFDRSIENMFAADDPMLVPYRRLKRVFAGDEVVLVAYVDPKLMTPEGMRRADRLSDSLAGVDGVTSVISVTTTPLGTDILTDQDRGPAFLKLFKDFALGADGQTAGMACTLDPAAGLKAHDRIVAKLRQVAQAHDPGAVLVGGPVMVSEGFSLIEQDFWRLGWISTGLLALVIVVCFRSIRWVAIPLVIVNATRLWTEGFLVTSGLELSMVSSPLWSLVTVQGIATVIHVVVHFRGARSTGRSPREALQVAGTLLAVPIVWTCLTDAAGFGALMAAHVGPVHDMGLMMAIASMLALLALLMLLPGLTLAGRFDVDPNTAWGETALSNVLRRSLGAVLRRPKTVVASGVLVVGIAALGCFDLQVESDFTRNYRAHSTLVRSYALVESRLGGAGVWDLVVPAPPPDDLSEEFLARLRRLQERLRNEAIVVDEDGRQSPGLTKVIGLVDGLDTVPTRRTLWRDVMLRVKYRRFVEQMPDVARMLYSADPQQPDRHYVRIMLRSLERQPSKQKQRLIAQVERICQEEFPATAEIPPGEASGFFVLLARLIDSVLYDQWVTFAIAVVAIGLMMCLAFRSVKLGLVALVPNIAPVLVLLGVLGWMDVKVNMGVAIIAAISMGLSIDAEIHYITAFCRLRREGHSVVESLAAVQQSVGRAVFFATLALCVGFGAMCLSDFVPTIYIGGLLSLAMLGGLIGNLTLLPVLLYLTVR